MILRQLDSELLRYDEAFTAFTQKYDLPLAWFQQPDHFAIKCADAADYAATCEELRGEANANGIWEVEMDQRKLASAQLIGKTTLGGHDFGWVEIMQPRPGKETDHGFVEHTEFLFPDFKQITQVLKDKKVAFELQKNPGHTWVNVTIDEMGREIKFNDRLLEDVVEHERAQGLLRKIT